MKKWETESSLVFMNFWKYMSFWYHLKVIRKAIVKFINPIKHGPGQICLWMVVTWPSQTRIPMIERFNNTKALRVSSLRMDHSLVLKFPVVEKHLSASTEDIGIPSRVLYSFLKSEVWLLSFYSTPMMFEWIDGFFNLASSNFTWSF